MLKPKDIKAEVDSVLRRVRVNQHNRGRSYLTAYQILAHLSPITKATLIAERGRPGKNAKRYYAAASVVSDAAEMISDVEIYILDASFLNVKINNRWAIEAGCKNVGLYRVKP